ncbi:MAG: hypothetical protein ACM3X7_04760 [Solirubrobacterales bacterium]
MKLKKNTAIILSFAIGLIMFSTTAMAEVVSKTGYEQLKDSVKYTADSCTKKLPNYTMDMSFVIKDNGKVISSDTTTNKVDVKGKAMESSTTHTQGGTNQVSYYYSDKNLSISTDGSQNIYYVNEYEQPKESRMFSNPFAEKEAGDVEKIADALVGNLKDSVVVKQNSDGSRELSGTLNETQIPALVNAVVSLQSKTTFNSNSQDNYMPKITNDIFIKDVTGNMQVGSDGVIRSVLGTGTVSGKDEGGTVHNVTFELLVKIYNINSTTVTKPDLTGKTVQKNVERDYNKLSNPELYIGKYKNDVIIEKDGRFQKIGDRYVTITKIDDKTISGTYDSEFYKGYEDYADKYKTLNFTGTFQKDNPSAEITCTDSSGATHKGFISVNQQSAGIYFNLTDSSRGFLLTNDQFNRIFN